MGEEEVFQFLSGFSGVRITPSAGIPEIIEVFTGIVGELPTTFSGIGYENLFAFCLALMVFAIFSTRISLEIGLIGAGITLLGISLIISNVTISPMIATSLIAMGIFVIISKEK